MSFRRLISALTFLAIFAMAVRVSVDTDTWWHLRSGQWMAEHGQILRADPFSLTRQGQPWIYPGWLAQLGMYATYVGLGLGGLMVATAAMVVVAFAFIWLAMPERPLLKAFVLILAAATSAVYWSARPQILSFALAGFFIWVLGERNTGKLWLLPPAMALWANLHGGFAIGLILLGAALLGQGVALLGKLRIATTTEREQSKRDWLRLAGVCAVSILAVSLNPHGPRMLLYPLNTVSIGVLRDYIQEWQSPDFHAVEVLPFMVMILATGAALALSKRPKRPTELITAGIFLSLSLLAARNIALFALVAAPLISRHLGGFLEGISLPSRANRQLPESLSRRINLGLLLLFALLALIKASFPLRTSVIQGAMETSLPLGAVDHLKQTQPEGPLFNSYNWGGLVIWELYPEYLTFVDGRTDLFDDEILEDFLTLYRTDPGWEELLAEWNIRLVLVETNAPIAQELDRLGWTTSFRDQQAVVLELEA